MSKSEYRRYKLYKFVSYGALAVIVIAAAAILFGLIIMLLWNSTIAEIFAIQAISFWQAIGLFFLAKLFFGFGSSPASSKMRSGDGKFRWAKFKDKSVKYQGFRKYWDEEGQEAYEKYRASQNQDPAPE